MTKMAGLRGGSGGMRERRRWIIVAIAIGAAMAIIHYLIRRFVPSFSVLYDGPERPQWIPLTIDAEFVVHFLYLGALIAVTGRSVPGLNKPTYSDDDPKSLFSAAEDENPIDWKSILAAWACVPVYVALWMLAYGYVG